MWKRAVCTKDCPDTCGLLVQVENGRITRVKGDPDHPFTKGFICKKAGYFPDHVHAESRITTPLKRTGPKGSGRFAPISWDEALDQVAQRMQATAREFGPEAIMPYSYAGHMGLVHRNTGQALFNRLGASALEYTICGAAGSAGYKVSLGDGPSTDIERAEKADLIIIWGSNTRVTNVHAWPIFNRARKNGARIVVVDPYRNDTAASADAHLMLKPGTDAALALGMMHVLIREHLVDGDFIARSTVGYDEFKERAAGYTPERSAGICGLTPGEITDLALAYGRAKSPFIRAGWGPARQLGGGMAMRTIALLPALVNAFATPGGGITRSLGGGLDDKSCLTRPDLRPRGTRVINMVELGHALTELSSPPVKMLYVYLSNPAAVAPQSRKVMEGLAREDLFVAVQEMYMTDTARFADIILPGASFLEVGDVYQAYGHNYVQRVDAVIPPVGDSRPGLEIFQGLAKRLGFDEPLFSMSEGQCMDMVIEANRKMFASDQDVEAVKNGEIVRANIPENPYAHGFDTPSGKVEFYSRAMADQGLDPLPDGTPLRDPDGGDRYPLECLTPPHRLLLNSAFYEIEAVRREVGEPLVLINPETAGERGIADGAMVRIFNDRGECQRTARVTKDTRPGVLVAEGLIWPGEPGKGSNQLTSQRLTDMGRTCAFHCNRVEVEPVRP